MNMVSRKAVTLAIKYLSEDPMNKLPKLFSLAEALDRGHQRTADIRRIRAFLKMKTITGIFMPKNYQRK